MHDMSLQSKGAFFDLDKTLIKGNLFFIFFKFLQKEKFTSIYSYLYIILLLMLSKLLNNREFIRHGMIMSISGNDKSEILKKWKGYVKVNVAKMLIQPSKDILLKHKNEGTLIFILTNNLDIAVEPIADILGVTKYISITNYEVRKGIIKHKLRFKKISIDKYKEAMKIINGYSINTDASFGYGDSIEDFAFLRTLGNSFIVKNCNQIVPFENSKV